MKVLILHASAGGGHARAAEALREAAHMRGDTVVVRDILDFMPELFRRTYANGYLNLVRTAPELWGYLYALSDRESQRPVARHVRAGFQQLNAVSFYRFLRAEAPDAVLCTHFLPLELIVSMRSRKRCALPLFGVVTDYAVHALWYGVGVDAYYVATEESRRQLCRKGQPKDQVLLSGIPVLAAFARRCTPSEGRRLLGLRPDLPLTLVLSGGYGVGPTVALLQACAVDPPPCQFVVITGHNAKLEQAARAAVAGTRLVATIHGFVQNIDEFMDAADLVISKPGGLTTAETLAKGRPMLIVDPIPGQEQRNAEWLLENGAAMRLHEVADAPWKLRAMLGEAAPLEALARRAAALGRPDAACDIIADVHARVGL
ncbi:MAG: MGDG synthase family glycosyltransferase [Kiritimatiellia bacterium]